MHAVSLFSGIGLLDLGLHRAGIETRIFCESDRAARGFLARRFPGIPIHPDVQELTADDLAAAGADPARTVLAGGFPCQDLSVAGSRADRLNMLKLMRVEALADQWRYKGEFGWGPWQEGYGPNPEGSLLDDLAGGDS